MEPEKQKFGCFSADLTEAKEVQRVFGQIVEWGGVPDIVWTCAGGFDVSGSSGISMAD